MRNRCVKCLGPLSADEVVVNKDMAYCADCAVILHLGESKESRMFKDLQGLEGEHARAPQAPSDADKAAVEVEELDAAGAGLEGEAAGAVKTEAAAADKAE